MLRNSKGQVTVFIIIAIVIVVIGVSIFIFAKGDKRDSYSKGTDSVSLFIQDCLENVGEEGLYFLGIQGGYYSVPIPKEKFNLIEIPIYWNAEEINLPSKIDIENEFSKYVDANLNFCLENFQGVKDEGLKITEIGNFSSNVLLGEKIILELTYPLSIEKGDSFYELKSFYSELDFDFEEKHSFVNSFLLEQEKNPDYFPLTYVTNLAHENDFNFELFDLDEDKTILSFVFNELNSENQPFVYSFIVDHGEK